MNAALYSIYSILCCNVQLRHVAQWQRYDKSGVTWWNV